jgi:hypothetical protein
MENQRRFRGIMAGYLHLFNRVRYMGSTLRDRIPLVPKSGSREVAPATWDLATFSRACSEVAASHSLDARHKALVNRLLVEADEQGYPLNVLTDPVESAGRLDWRQRNAQSVIEALHEVEQHWTNPRGRRRILQGTLIFLANWVPLLALLGACVLLLWRFTMIEDYKLSLGDLWMPAIVLVVVLVMFQVLIAVLLPMRWPAIRGEFQEELTLHLARDLEQVYCAVPVSVAEGLLQERKKVKTLEAEVNEVADWLKQREQAATIAGLYGH